MSTHHIDDHLPNVSLEIGSVSTSVLETELYRTTLKRKLPVEIVTGKVNTMEHHNHTTFSLQAVLLFVKRYNPGVRKMLKVLSHQRRASLGWTSRIRGGLERGSLSL